MKIPDLLTLSVRYDDIPGITVHAFLEADLLIKEMDQYFKLSPTFRPFFLEVYLDFNPSITDEEIQKAKHPFKDFLHAKYGFMCANDMVNAGEVSFEKFLEEEFREGFLFESADHQNFIDVTLHRANIDWRSGSNHLIYSRR